MLRRQIRSLPLKLVVQEDEAELLGYSNKVFDEYYAGAKNTKYFDAYHVTKGTDVIPQYLRAFAEQKCEGLCSRTL